MNHLGRGDVKHPYVFDKGLATHVVTGTLYGDQALFQSLTVSVKEDHQDIEGQASLTMGKKEEANVEKLLRDFCLPKTPASFQDAVQVYQSLPTLLGPSGEKPVPVKVWLLPLTGLDSSAAKLSVK